MIKIVLTGPESTGKSTLARQLASHFGTTMVAEYARHFISELDRDYVEADLLEIARGQLDWEQEQCLKADEILICDTDLLTIKIWSEFKFGNCNPQILKWIEEGNYHHYLLCGTDVKWQFDPQREHPYKREVLYSIYKKELNFYKKEYTEIAGTESQRFEKAIESIHSVLKNTL